jgi:uncharacterized protein
MSNPSQNIAENFNKEKDRIQKTIRSLKKRPPKDLDSLFHALNDEVFEKINCLDCANCCKTTSPILFEKDIERLAHHLRLKPGDFIKKYVFMDEDGFYTFSQIPCPFLLSDNSCSVYDYRPKACREYPHTNQRKMHTLLNLAEKNAEICPAVLEIIKKLSNQFTAKSSDPGKR